MNNTNQPNSTPFFSLPILQSTTTLFSRNDEDQRRIQKNPKQPKNPTSFFLSITPLSPCSFWRIRYTFFCFLCLCSFPCFQHWYKKISTHIWTKQDLLAKLLLFTWAYVIFFCRTTDASKSHGMTLGHSWTHVMALPTVWVSCFRWSTLFLDCFVVCIACAVQPSLHHSLPLCFPIF